MHLISSHLTGDMSTGTNVCLYAYIYKCIFIPVCINVCARSGTSLLLVKPGRPTAPIPSSSAPFGSSHFNNQCTGYTVNAMYMTVQRRPYYLNSLFNS